MSSIIRATTTSGLQVAPDNSGSLQLQTNGTTTAVTIDTSQNVGIGTTSPTSSLVVAGAAAGTPTINGVHLGTQSGYATIELVGTSGTGSLIDFTQSGTDTKGRILYDNTNNYMALNTNAAERMRIDSSGNVLVGTATVPNTGAGTNSTIASNKDYSAAFAQIINSTNTSGIQYFTQFARGASECGRIVSSTTNSTTYATSSDYRLKENIAPMTGALDTVAKLKPVTYTWKQDGSDGQGFIAHELQAIIPDAVVGEKDELNENGSIKPQGIDTSFLVATLTAAIQEQQTIINDLKARIETLEAK